MKIILLLILTISTFCSQYSFSEQNKSTIGKVEQPSGSLTFPEYSPGELIVKISPDTSLKEFKTLNDQMGAFNAKKVFPNLKASDHSLNSIYIIRFSQDAKIERLACEYAKSPLIDDVNPNYLRKSCADEIIPDDEKFEEMWNLEKIDMPRAWSIEKGNPKVVIAIIDGGIDYTHPDLKSKIWINEDEIPSNGVDDDENGYVDDHLGWDFTDAPTLPGKGDYVERDNDPMDESTHGTHVAGIAGAEVNNQIGIAGVAWNCKLMAIRAGVAMITGGSRLQDDDSASAIVYAADNGSTRLNVGSRGCIKVINMSWGDYEDSFIIKDAIDYAFERGCVLVGAAGNNYSPEVIYPAGYTNVIAVASTNQLDSRFYGSNFGSVIDVGAPGNVIISTIPGNRYGILTGTSMATPHVAGAAALLRSKRPALTNEEIRQIIVSSADRTIDSPELVGAGRLNVANALLASSSLQAKITKPGSRDGGDRSIEIVGSANGFKFTGWRLQYGKSNVPENWWNIASGTNAKFDELIYLWDTSKIEKGIYTIRLTSIGNDDKLVRDEIIVLIDHSPPIIIDFSASTSLINEYLTTNVSWQTDELCYSQFYYRPSDLDSFEYLSPNSIRRTHFFSLSYELPPGDYECFVSSRNLAGLQTVDDNDGNFYNITVFSDLISPTEFAEEKTNLPAMYSISAIADFDGDLRYEIVGTESYDISTVKIYENSANGYNLVFESSEQYLPLELCDLDADGRWEILGSVYRRRILFECPTKTGSYPIQKVWEAKGCLSSKTADLNGNGMAEIIIFSKYNEIVIYEAFGNDNYQEIARLSNPTDGEGIMEADSVVDDLDGDGRMELVVADSDGDLFAYESLGDDRFHHAWTKRIDLRKAHEMDTGDLDGDGKPELVVGGVVLDGNGRSIYWKCLLFKSTGDDQVYEVGEQKIQNFYADMKSNLSIKDLDEDGRNEVLVVVPPNAYVFEWQRGEEASGKRENGETIKRNTPVLFIVRQSVHETRNTHQYFAPIWHHPAREGTAVFSPEGFYFNGSDRFTRFFHNTSADDRSRPYALIAVPIDENRVVIYWKGNNPVASEDAISSNNSYTVDENRVVIYWKGNNPVAFEDAISSNNSYTVYRGMTDIDSEKPLFLELIATNITDTEFTDKTVTKRKVYWYAVSSFNTYETKISIETIEENSGFSELVSAIPDTPPELTSAKYLQTDRVCLEFDQPMSKSIQDVNLYSLIDLSELQGEKFRPSSAILVESGQKIILAFKKGILTAGYTYELAIGELRNKNRIRLDLDVEIEIVVPELRPEICGLSQVLVYPNPIEPNQHDVGHITFANLPIGTMIRIYDVGGTLLEELEATESCGGKKLWYLTNQNKFEISSGVYVYSLEFDGELKTGKIAIIK